MENIVIFGSEDSTDIDVFVIVDYIQNNAFYGIERCKKYDIEIAKFLKTDIKVNSNLVIIKDGIVTKVLKGTCCEANNSILDTYHLHKQYIPNPITKRVERDISLKISRTIRVLLSFISKTQYRADVKAALNNHDMNFKINVLENIDISTISDLGGKNIDMVDFMKTYAFQLGQTLALMNGKELYTKTDIGIEYPELKPFLQRVTGCDISVLNIYKNKFLKELGDIKYSS